MTNTNQTSHTSALAMKLEAITAFRHFEAFMSSTYFANPDAPASDVMLLPGFSELESKLEQRSTPIVGVMFSVRVFRGDDGVAFYRWQRIDLSMQGLVTQSNEHLAYAFIHSHQTRMEAVLMRDVNLDPKEAQDAQALQELGIAAALKYEREQSHSFRESLGGREW